MQGALHKRKSGEYLRVVETKVDLTIGGAKSFFGNLFNGDSVLSEYTSSPLRAVGTYLASVGLPIRKANRGMVAWPLHGCLLLLLGASLSWLCSCYQARPPTGS